jgi:uncharacterized protein (DUF302 family)
MLFTAESKKPIQLIEKLFPEVAARHKFGILGVHNLKAKMNEKGVPFDRDCLIFELCNPQKAKRVLESNMEMSTMLPCRVAVYEEKGTTKIVMFKPTALIEQFPGPGLRSVAEDVEKDLVEIIQDLARP